MSPAEAQGLNGHLYSVQWARLRIQKKSWRAKMVLSDRKRQEKMLLLCYCTPPIERMQSYLTYADSCSRCLWDITFDDALNPFFTCRKGLAALQRSGTDGRMAPVFEFFGEDHRAELLSEFGQMVGSVCAQAD